MRKGAEVVKYIADREVQLVHADSSDRLGRQTADTVLPGDVLRVPGHLIHEDTAGLWSHLTVADIDRSGDRYFVHAPDISNRDTTIWFDGHEEVLVTAVGTNVPIPTHHIEIPR